GLPVAGADERRDADERLPDSDGAVPGGADQRVLYDPAVLGPSAVQVVRGVVPQPAADLPGTGGQPHRAGGDPTAGPDDRGEVNTARRGTLPPRRAVVLPDAPSADR